MAHSSELLIACEEDVRHMRRILRTVALYRKPDANHAYNEINSAVRLSADLIPDTFARIDCGIFTAGIYPQRAREAESEFTRIISETLKSFVKDGLSFLNIRAALVNDEDAYRLLALGVFYGLWTIDTHDITNPVACRKVPALTLR